MKENKKVKKKKLTLTVTQEEREYLAVLAKEKGLSVSKLIGAYATAEHKKLQRAKRKAEKKKRLLEEEDFGL